MKKEYIMGNGAIALGALAAGVKLAAGYPGTPSSEIIETIRKYSHENVYLEWSVNEKAALEAAAAAAISGARALVTMKQVGLNVASDPLMSLAYLGVKGGMVVVSADDPGPISSQTEQDTRMFAAFCRIPVFDPSSPEEAYEMIQEAFDYSEKYRTPVLFRPTTRICHAYAPVEVKENTAPKEYKGFSRDPSKWVIFPRLSYKSHLMIEERNPVIGEDFSDYCRNICSGSGKKAVFASGISYAYAKEYLKDKSGVKLCKISTPFPFPEKFALSCLEGVEQAICLEELSPFVENELQRLIGVHKLNVDILGKSTSHVPAAGELSADIAADIIGKFVGEAPCEECDLSDAPRLPARPPVLCAGCPHRASFYAVKLAMRGRKSIFCGDIGCYTLGNAMPLDMVDTCLCMGAGVTMAQGFAHTNSDTACFAFIGDSTFFASGMTGVVNAVYNQADVIICILDNSTTAMTGHQPHPGTGRSLMNENAGKLSIERIIEGMGVDMLKVIDPFDLPAAVDAVKEAADTKGVKVIIFRAPCAAIEKRGVRISVSDVCIGCKKCIKELGCPALSYTQGRVTADKGLCTGCGLCARICPVSAIGVEENG